MKVKDKKQISLWLALLIVSLLIAKYTISSWRKYQAWETHKSFFALPLEEQKVKTWMSPNFIQRHYGIDFGAVIGFSPGFWEARKPLIDLCNNHHLNCDMLIEKLNARILNHPDNKSVH